MSAKFLSGSLTAYSKNYVQRPAVFRVKRGVVQAIRTNVFGGLATNNQIFGSTNFANDAKAVSYLGTPVETNLILGDGENVLTKYVDIEGNELTYYGLQIDTVIMEVSMTKNIIKTSIQGKSGTIKEYVNDGDYIINVSGRLSLKTNVYPESNVNRLIKICQIPDSVPVTSDFLQLFGINEIVIDDFKLPQEKGIRNEQGFEITMTSEIPILLEYANT